MAYDFVSKDYARDMAEKAWQYGWLRDGSGRAQKGVPIFGQSAVFMTIFVRSCSLPEHRKEDSPPRTLRPQRKLGPDKKRLSHHRGAPVE